MLIIFIKESSDFNILVSFLYAKNFILHQFSGYKFYFFEFKGSNLLKKTVFLCLCFITRRYLM